jgi:hypothetical protein
MFSAERVGSLHGGRGGRVLGLVWGGLATCLVGGEVVTLV